MLDELKTMEGASQHIRPSRQSNNSPNQQGNSPRPLARSKGGQLKLQKSSKLCPPGNGQRNAFPNPGKPKGHQNPQKKGYLANKRPAARGARQTERFNQLSVEDDELHLNNDFPVTSKKDHTSLNHLLNFTFAPREQVHHVFTSRKKVGMKGSSYNKEQFLQANCQFVVQDGGNYAVNTVDPDVMVDWELVEQVRVRCREMPSCPICLYPPTAAQITRCGHIYCWSCILHYLSLSEKTWKRCPICYESIHRNDLKSVVAVSENKHSYGQHITMTLMKRAKGSVFALPKVRWIERDSVPLFASDELEMQFSKLLIASPQEILTKIMAKDRSELKGLLLEMENDKSDEEPFVKLAMEEFEKREKRLGEMCCTELKDMEEKRTTTGSRIDGMDEKKSSIVLTENMTISNCGSDERSRRSSVSSDDSVTSHLSSGSAQFYYFYQAQDGQHIFLHPVNARCLIKEYGSLENCPESISGNIVEMECFSQTEEVRHRFRYLRHLPLTCEFAMCELDLKPPLLSRETLDFFKDDLRKRRARRQKKAKDEARHESKCSSKVSAFTGIKQPRTNCSETPDLTSEQDFPQQVGSSSEVWVSTSPPTSGPWASVTADEEKLPSGPSFAKALSTGSPAGPKPRPKVRTQSENSRADGEKGSEDEDECETVPSFQSAFTDALMAADWNLKVKDVDQESKSQGKKNKRKGKGKKVLFSTGGAMKL